MKLCTSAIYLELRSLARKNVRATCLVLTYLAGLVYLCNFGFDCTFAAATCSILILGCVADLPWCSAARDEIKETEVVLVTGCDTGLGYSLALHLKSIGLGVIAAVHRKDSPGALELSATRGIFVHPLDLTNSNSVKEFRNAVNDYLIRNGFVLRAFVNNAGSMIFGEFEWQTEEQARQQIEVNLIGTMRVTREFMPIIRAHSTRIIVVTSHCAVEPLPGVAAYGATKAGLSAWSTALRVELKKYGIDVVNFVPGSFIRESNLLSQQRKHFEAMESAMSEETRSFYGDYFTRYASYLSNLAPTNLPQRLMNPMIYDKFEGALLDRNPRPVYKCEPWRYMLYHTLFKILPTTLRDRLVESFVQLPAWKDNVCVANAERADGSLCRIRQNAAKVDEVCRISTSNSTLQGFSAVNNCDSKSVVDTVEANQENHQTIEDVCSSEKH